MSDRILTTVYFNNEKYAALKQYGFHFNVSKTDIINVALEQLFVRWADNDDALIKDDLTAEMCDPAKMVIPTYQADKKFSNWRSRRIAIVQAATSLRQAIDNINVDDDEFPLDHKPREQTKTEILELTNLVNVMMRMLLIANDGRVSESRLAAF